MSGFYPRIWPLGVCLSCQDLSNPAFNVGFPQATLSGLQGEYNQMAEVIGEATSILIVGGGAVGVELAGIGGAPRIRKKHYMDGVVGREGEAKPNNPCNKFVELLIQKRMVQETKCTILKKAELTFTGFSLSIKGSVRHSLLCGFAAFSGSDPDLFGSVTFTHVQIRIRDPDSAYLT